MIWPFKKRELRFTPYFDRDAVYYQGYSAGLQKGMATWTEHALLVLETAGPEYLTVEQIEHLKSLIKMEAA